MILPHAPVSFVLLCETRWKDSVSIHGIMDKQPQRKASERLFGPSFSACRGWLESSGVQLLRWST